MSLRGSSKHLWRLLLLMGLALGLRLWQIQTLPPGFHFDEAFEGLEAWRILTDPAYRPIFLEGNFGVPPLNAYANALMFAIVPLFGGSAGPLAMRLTAVCFGLLGILALYGLAHEIRLLTRPRLTLSVAFPLWAAAVLTIMRWHLHFSRMGIEPILVPLQWSAATYFFLHGWRTGRWWSFALSGLVLAAAMYTYQGAWIIPFLLIPTMAWLRLDQNRSPQSAAPTPSIRQHFLGSAVTAGIALLLFAPLGWFIVNHVELVLTRPAQLSIVGETSSPADSGVGAALWATAKMFGPLGASGDLDPRRNVPGLPALSVWLALPFYLGLALALWRCRQPAYAIPLIGLGGLLLPGILSEYAPHFHRILGAAAPTALLCAIGLDRLWQWRPRRAPYAHWLALVLFIGGGVTESYNYFVRWARLPDLFYAFDVGLWQVGQTMAAQATTPLYLTPRSADHATLAFAWTTRAPTAAQPPVTFDGRQIFPFAAQQTRSAEAYAVIEHEDFRTRLLLPSLFPTATVTTEIQDSQGNPYARLYERAAGTVTQRKPQHEFATTLGDGIDLIGYDLQPTPLQVGTVLYLQLYWRVTATPRADWTVFTHLRQVDAAGNSSRVTGQDSQPGGGSLPTSRWQAGWEILDEYQLALPADLPPGSYTIAIGLYQPTGERLPTTGTGVMLGEVQIE
ncbi:MAG: hypothetical protein KF832_19855 [Caldilineaceae bacterium]|nr:hypothetical protein [Caldilineaceae bacterium]